MRISIILIFSSLLQGCITTAQEKSVEDYLLKTVSSITNPNVRNEVIKNNKCVFNVPAETKDVLLNICRKYLMQENNQLDKHCQNGCIIKTEYEIKSYEPSKYISILEKRYFECPSMPSPSNSSRGINFIIFEKNTYEIQVLWNSESKKFLDTLIAQTFEKDCIDNGSLNDDLDLFIQDGKFYINNPLHTDYCDEVLVLPNVIGKLKFIKIN